MKTTTALALIAASVLTPRTLANDSSYTKELSPPRVSGAPLDEAMAGKTPAGNPLVDPTGNRYPDEYLQRPASEKVKDYPAERRDVFAPMDQHLGEGGRLIPLDLNPSQIMGRNTWILWPAGNEAFWNWLQQHGYGFVDFLKLIDSRKRATRFQDTGLINQPGMTPRAGPGPWGLWLDEVATPLPNTNGGLRYDGASWPEYHDGEGRTLRSDGVNPAVYGFPSGVVGIRLFPNPDFTDEAKKRWDSARYYDEQNTDPSYYLDPKLVRPFRVGMSCGVCHVGPHPLVPPADPNNPAWENLSSTIGSQYLKTQAVFGNLLKPDNLIYHYLRSQQPGTIDTSLTATDHINNSNTMTAIWDIPARLQRARDNPRERQSEANLRLKSIEDKDNEGRVNPRHTPRVLVDGSDSIGAFGALARVYLNIGTYYELWNEVQNPVIGFRPQRPFSIAACQANSVFWQVNEKYRTDYLAAFFTHPRSTAPMKLADIAKYGAEPHRQAARDALTPARPEWNAARGREVFVQNCMLCHSSKQPPNIVLRFADLPDGAKTWEEAPAHVPTTRDSDYFVTLPRDYRNWGAFKNSPSYRAYLEQAKTIAGAAPAPDQPDPFLQDNFLSIEQRIRVSLVGTNAGRAVATNGMSGHVWSDFSSEDYKALPAVGAVRIHNPYVDPNEAAALDPFGNNDTYSPPGGGPGYYRPATLIGIWATAPYLHNNALGRFTHDPSVKGRLENFEDGITKLLWNDQRRKTPSGPVDSGMDEGWNTRDEAGWIYRTTETTDIRFPAKYIHMLVTSVAGTWTVRIAFAGLYVLAALLLIASWLTGTKLPPHLPGVILILIGAALAWVLFGRAMAAMTELPVWLLPAVLIIGGGVVLLWPPSVKVARIVHVGTSLSLVLAAVLGQLFLHGKLGDLRVGPFPRGTPINLILNMNPEAPTAVRLDAIASLFKGMQAAKKLLPPALSACELAALTPEQRADRATREDHALLAFEKRAGKALVNASKCPDYVLDRGHWFGEYLGDDDKHALIAFLKTL